MALPLNRRMENNLAARSSSLVKSRWPSSAGANDNHLMSLCHK